MILGEKYRTGICIGNTVTLAVRALRHDRIGEDLKVTLRDDEAIDCIRAPFIKEFPRSMGERFRTGELGLPFRRHATAHDMTLFVLGGWRPEEALIVAPGGIRGCLRRRNSRLGVVLGTFVR